MEQQPVYPVQYEDDLEPQQQNQYPIIQKGEKADLLDKIKPEYIVEQLRHRLMGEEWNGSDWVAVKELSIKVWNPESKQYDVIVKHAVTPVCAWDMANLMLSASSQNISISKLTEREIKERMKSINKTLWKMLLKNWKEYGITGVDQLKYIKTIVFNNTYSTLKQSQNGWIGEIIKKTTAEFINRQSSDNKPQGQGLLSSFNIFRKNK